MPNETHAELAAALDQHAGEGLEHALSEAIEMAPLTRDQLIAIAQVQAIRGLGRRVADLTEVLETEAAGARRELRDVVGIG